MSNEEGTDCPIQSNIHSTAGKYDDTPQFDDDEDNSNSDDDAAFNAEFENDAADDDDDGWGSAVPFDEDYIPMVKPPSPKAQIGADGENLGGEGARIKNGARPEIKGDPKHKCWICHVCNAINNLLETFQKYDMRCCICKYAFKPEAPIIFSHDWDGPRNDDEQVYTVWDCPFCTLKNDINWATCATCNNEKPPADQIQLSYLYQKPKMHVNEPAAVDKVQGGHANIHNRHDNNRGNNYGANGVAGGLGNSNWKSFAKPLHRRVIPPRIANIGVERAVTKYPTDSFESKCEERLTNIFGMPYRNKHVIKKDHHCWAKQITVGHSRLEWSTYSNDAVSFIATECVGRGIAINQRTGWMACMSCNELWVFEPIGASGFKLIVKHTFTNEQVLNGEDMQNSRIRFVGDNIYIWSFKKARVYVYKLFSHGSLSLIDVIKDRYFKDSQTMDVLVTDNLLILLFDRWCGVYKLYPKFEWYHAVAFATKPVNCFSFEMVEFDDFQDRTPISQEKFFQEHADVIKDDDDDSKTGFVSNFVNKLSGRNPKNNKSDDDCKNELEKDSYLNYLFINCESQLIGIHPSNPTFDFLRVASDCQHAKCKFCVSRKYGSFYLSNDGFQLYQSPNQEHKTVCKIIDLSDLSNNNNNNNNNNEYQLFPIEAYHDLVLTQGISQFMNVLFDETFGISGRLLLYCKTKKSDYFIHQMYNQNELRCLFNELSQIDYYLMPGMDKPPFNLIKDVFEMLYGHDLIQTLVQNPMFNMALQKIKKIKNVEMKNDNDKNNNNNQINGNDNGCR